MMSFYNKKEAKWTSASQSAKKLKVFVLLTVHGYVVESAL